MVMIMIMLKPLVISDTATHTPRDMAADEVPLEHIRPSRRSVIDSEGATGHKRAH